MREQLRKILEHHESESGRAIPHMDHLLDRLIVEVDGQHDREPQRCWTELTREIKGIPSEFAAAVSSGRPELCRMLHRPLSLEETRAVADALVVFMESNQRLQDHSRALAEGALQLRDNVKGVLRKLEDLQALANLQPPLGDEDD